jgi:probable phosphoglycerate mutase
MATVLLVRHGETPWNREGRIQGWAPTPLTDRGHEQARTVAAELAARGVDRVVASDLRRAQETAREVGRATSAPVSFDSGWRERSLGVYQGLLAEDLWETYPEFGLLEVGYLAATVTPEGGESIVDGIERTLEAWDRLLADLDADETVAVVAHGGPLRAVLADLRGLDVLEMLLELEVDNCAVVEVAVDGGEPSLVDIFDGPAVAAE